MSNASNLAQKTKQNPRPFIVALLSVVVLFAVSWSQSRLLGAGYLSGWTGFMAGSWTAVLVAIGAYLMLPKRTRFGFLVLLMTLCLCINFVGYSVRVEVVQSNIEVTDSRPLTESGLQALRMTVLAMIPGYMIVPLPGFSHLGSAVDSFFPPPPKFQSGRLPLQMAEVSVFIPATLALNLFLSLVILVPLYSSIRKVIGSPPVGQQA